jgi:hypothetical protein
MLKAKGTTGVAGIWLDDHQLVEAAKKVKAEGFDKIEAISPFPLHGIDDALGIPRSFIPWVTFTMGLFGFCFGLWFTWWVAASNWPLNVGGKPFFSLPAFIPVIFELVILFAALSSVATLIIAAGLPKVDPPIIDPDLTSHKFALFIPKNSSGYDEEKIKSLFQSLGADTVKVAEY